MGVHGLTTSTPLSNDEQADEALLMGLRLNEGLSLQRLATINATMPSARTIDGLIAHGLLHRIGNDRIAATRSGRLVLNAVIAELSAAMEKIAA